MNLIRYDPDGTIHIEIAVDGVQQDRLGYMDTPLHSLVTARVKPYLGANEILFDRIGLPMEIITVKVDSESKA